MQGAQLSQIVRFVTTWMRSVSQCHRQLPHAGVVLSLKLQPEPGSSFIFQREACFSSLQRETGCTALILSCTHLAVLRKVVSS